MNNTDLALVGQIVLGYVMQWARSFQKVPNWLPWVVIGAAAVATYIWITPSFFSDWTTNWRTALAAIASFILATRGASALAKETKSAPPTNSI